MYGHSRLRASKSSQTTHIEELSLHRTFNRIERMSNPNNLPMTTSSTDSSKKTEEHKVSGGELLDKVKQIIRDGNARKITIKSEAGKVLLEIPLTLGVVGVVLAPVWIAIGTIAALAGRYTIVVEKRT